MRLHRHLLIALALVACVGVEPVPASNHGEETTIVLHGWSSGTWTATGGFDDSGTWSLEAAHDSGSLEHSPVVGAFQLTLVLIGQDGSTMTVQMPGLFSIVPDVELDGAWSVVDGTGAYARLHGAGRFVSSGSTWTLTGMTRLGDN